MQQLIIIILFVITILSVTICILNILKLDRVKRLNKKLLKSLGYKNIILSENSKIRHEYNNIFQTLINLIEENNIDGLHDYKSSLIERTHMISRNSLTQLSKIKDLILFHTVFLLYEESKSIGINLNVFVSQEIKNEYAFADAFSNILMDCIRNVTKSKLIKPKKIDLYIKEGNQGICFRFEHEYDQVNQIPVFDTIKLLEKNKSDITYNTFQKGNHLVQEIMLT